MKNYIKWVNSEEDIYYHNYIKNKKCIRITTLQKWKSGGKKKSTLSKKNNQEKVPGSELREGVKFPQHLKTLLIANVWYQK